MYVYLFIAVTSSKHESFLTNFMLESCISENLRNKKQEALNLSSRYIYQRLFDSELANAADKNGQRKILIKRLCEVYRRRAR